jgi:putative ABC transport system ATP-binding protein
MAGNWWKPDSGGMYPRPQSLFHHGHRASNIGRMAQKKIIAMTHLPGALLVELKEVSKIYATDAGEIPVLKNITLGICAGEFVGILGPSGSGKSTLLNVMTGIDHPSHGEVVVDGIVIQNYSEDQLARWRGRRIGVVFQFFQLLPALTLLENVILPMEFCKIGKSTGRRQQALRLLTEVGIEHLANKLPGMVSGGEQQRAAIARALATDPPLIVADEPTGNLDTANAEVVIQLFESLVQRDKTVIMVTHNPELCERMSRLIHMRDGQIVETKA